MNKVEFKKLITLAYMPPFRMAFAILALSALAACSQPARVSQMAVPNMLAPIVAANSELLGAMSVGDVSGGKATNPLWTSQVDNPQFKEALERSLEFNGLLASPGTNPRLVVSATLVELKQPFIGLDFTVTPKVVYRVVQPNGEVELLREELVTPYTADFSSSFIAVERLRLANEGAIRESIKRFLVRFGEVWSSRTGRPATPIVPQSPANAPAQPSS
jgi:hypothetical protein